MVIWKFLGLTRVPGLMLGMESLHVPVLFTVMLHISPPFLPHSLLHALTEME